MWLEQDKKSVGSDDSISQAEIEASELFQSFKRHVHKISGGARFVVKYGL